MNTTTYYLEMLSPLQLKRKLLVADFNVQEVSIPQFEFNKFLYILVGEPWNWTDRLSWTDTEWKNYAENPKLKTFVAHYKGTPAGYFELEQKEKGNVHIHLFGLSSSFIGKGMGGYFLTKALEISWSLPKTKRIWLTTCSDDHPSALQNYISRGMEVYKEVSTTK